jgi:hypothetical protein
VKFSFSHSFSAGPDRVAQVMLDASYQASLDGLTAALAERALLSQDERPDGTVVRRVRCVLGFDLGAAQRFVGNAEPAWVEVATWEPSTLRWEWRVEPEVGGDLLSANGAIDLSEAGGGTLRTVTGDVRVRVPIYGGRVESAIVGHLEGAYDAEAERLREWLERVTRA